MTAAATATTSKFRSRIKEIPDFVWAAAQSNADRFTRERGRTIRVNIYLDMVDGSWLIQDEKDKVGDTKKIMGTVTGAMIQIQDEYLYG